MNGSKRIISCILLVLLFTLGASAATESIVPYASELIGARYIDAWAYGDGEIEFTAEIVAVGPVDKLGFSSLKIQEKQGSRWVTVKSAYSKYATNAAQHDYTISYDGTREMTTVWSSCITQRTAIFQIQRPRPAAF